MRQSAEQYVRNLYPSDTDLESTLMRIRTHGMPEISIPFAYGKLLTLLVQISGAKNILEIGALGGYSGICLARGLDTTGRIISLELNEQFAAVAKESLLEAGYREQVEYRTGEALDSLRRLEAEGLTFDLFFIDADKENYPAYLEWALKLANPGALIIGDNALLNGRVSDSGANAPSVIAMRRFNERIANDPRLESILIPAYDGLMIARVKS